MKYTAKKITALLMALIMILSMTPLSALTEEDQSVRDASPKLRTNLRGTNPGPSSSDQMTNVLVTPAGEALKLADESLYLVITNVDGTVWGYALLNNQEQITPLTNYNYFPENCKLYIVATNNAIDRNTKIANLRNAEVTEGEADLGYYHFSQNYSKGYISISASMLSSVTFYFKNKIGEDAAPTSLPSDYYYKLVAFAVKDGKMYCDQKNISYSDISTGSTYTYNCLSLSDGSVTALYNGARKLDQAL